MIRMTLAQLEAFYWTVTLGSVEAASQRLHLSQPSVSQRLKLLQSQFDMPLTERQGRGLRITPSGQEVLFRAERILREVEEMESASEPAQLRGPVRIGVAEGLALVCLPLLMQQLRDRHTLLKLEIAVGISSDLEPRLQSHELDIAFLVNPSEHPDFTLSPMGLQETSWVAGANWSLPDLVRPRDLIDVPIVTNDPGSINFRQVKSWFASAGLAPQREDICSSVSMLAHVVTSGAAVGVLPVRMTEPYRLRGELRILRTSPAIPATPIHAKFRTQGVDPAARAVLGVMRQLLEGLGYTGND
ncbi:LysR family transcriptional regulator [Martelella soudanensis]|uniref:LysR family transcriptional regulator n=1 Tax=unclassified Martelella TaxID=2629616 RepID=UPI0015DDA592|nr:MULTISPECIES: LysR family transcriptional regulator [unclassified Martelella]